MFFFLEVNVFNIYGLTRPSFKICSPNLAILTNIEQSEVITTRNMTFDPTEDDAWKRWHSLSVSLLIYNKRTDGALYKQLLYSPPEH